jgi:ABC-2 type transport system ATP-binding protein
MKMITSYLHPDEGTIKILGQDCVENSLETRKHIGYLPEHNPLYLEMYVREYLQFVAEIHKIDHKKTRINELIDIVGLQKEQHKKIGELSKGYRQRVGLAQALIHDPEILILDEPTSGLDMNQLKDIRKLIRNLGKEKTVILSTHIMQEVQALCDRVIIINNGRIVADDPIELLTGNISGDAQLELEILNETKVSPDFKSIQGVNQIHFKNGVYTISHDANVDIRPDVFYLCSKNNTPILSMHSIEANVEDVFQQLTLGENV